MGIIEHGEKGESQTRPSDAAEIYCFRIFKSTLRNKSHWEERIKPMKTFLRLDAVSILVGAVVLHILWGGSWWLFALFAILPDVSFLAYIGYDGTARWPCLFCC